MTEAQQHPCGNAVARRRRVVGEALGTVDQGFVIARGEIETTGCGILEVLPRHLDELPCEVELGGAKTHLLQLEDRVGEKYVVIEVGVEMCTAVHRRREQPA